MLDLYVKKYHRNTDDEDDDITDYHGDDIDGDKSRSNDEDRGSDSFGL